jgi:UDPglucose--hexose-1-phosphate uridylyltransferase
MDLSKLSNTPHRRLNPLTGDWVLVSPQRTQRPWQGKVERTATDAQPTYDPNCYLCPGNTRAGGVKNPPYTSTFAFNNDYPALIAGTGDVCAEESSLLVARSEPGVSRVVCFSPRHDLTIPRMQLSEIRGVVDVWASEYATLGAQPWVNHVEIFENRGAMMGASNPHPHCQIWANKNVPNVPAREQERQAAYEAEQGNCLLCDYVALEARLGERVVCENDSFVVLVPFWAVWPFETMLLSKRHLTSIDELSDNDRTGLADVLRQITTRYDNLFEVPFPYTMGFHQRPTDGQPHPEWHFHAHYLPPLLRSASVQKFMVGYELLASPQRDITPESAAERLRNLPAQHYLGSVE